MTLGPFIIERFRNVRPRLHVLANRYGVQLRLGDFGLHIGFRK